MKCWEIIADNLKKRGWSLGWVSALDLAGERSGLHQPDLLTYFQTRLQAMSEFNLPIVHQIQDALVEVKPLINIGNARISAESVKKVNEITTRLGNDIIKKD